MSQSNDDDEQPDVWEQAVALAKGETDDDAGGDTQSSPSGGKSKNFDDDDLDF